MTSENDKSEEVPAISGLHSSGKSFLRAVEWVFRN